MSIANSPRRTRLRRTLVSTFGLFTLLLALLVVLAPSASAQTASDTFSTDQRQPADADCLFVGTITMDQSDTYNGEWCRPVGFTPVMSLADCAELAIEFEVPYPFDGTCYFAGYNGGATSCEAPAVLIDLTTSIDALTGEPYRFEGPAVGCALPWIVGQTPVPAPDGGAFGFDNGTGGQAPSGIYACIESPEVQNAPASAGLSVGNTFVGTDYQTYVITYGAPTCTFDTSGCSPALNFSLVDDVKACIAEQAAAALVAEAAPAVDTAPAAAAAVPAVQPAIVVAELAHTGEEHVLAGAFATSLVGAGFAALALRRFARRRND